MLKDAMHDADRHGEEWEAHFDHNLPRPRMGVGQLFSAGVLVGASSYFIYHVLRFILHNHILDF